MIGRIERAISFPVVACLLGLSVAFSNARGVEIPGWGDAVDPVGDCEFGLEKGKFTITVPGDYHDLWPVKGKVNAPLVLQEVEGDFTIEVLVASITKAEPDTVLPGMTSTASFHAASLVIWQDSKNIVRLDRTDMHNRGRSVNACYLHVFRDGQRVVEAAPAVSDKPTHLRLARSGSQLTASYSQDGGRSWATISEMTISLPNKVRVGVSAVNNTNRVSRVVFEELKLIAKGNES